MKSGKCRDIEQEMQRFEEMKGYFSVDFETGLITKIKTTSGRGKIGDIVKCKTNAYIQFMFKGKNVLVHRYIFYCYHGHLPEFIDPENAIKSDNWISNLRAATQRQNLQNQIRPQDGDATGFSDTQQCQ